jgi:hypothetical protein
VRYFARIKKIHLFLSESFRNVYDSALSIYYNVIHGIMQSQILCLNWYIIITLVHMLLLGLNR